MEGKDGPDDGREVDNDTLVIDSGTECFAEIDITAELGQKTDNLLQLINDLMVDGQFTVPDQGEVLANLGETGVQAPERL